MHFMDKTTKLMDYMNSYFIRALEPKLALLRLGQRFEAVAARPCYRILALLSWLESAAFSLFQAHVVQLQDQEHARPLPVLRRWP